MTERSPVDQMLNLLSGHLVTQSLHVAAVLGVADHIVAGHTTTDAIARMTGTQPQFLGRLLRALASLGVLEGDGKSGFALTPLGDTLRSDSAALLRDKAIVEGLAPIWTSIAGMSDVMHDGKDPFEAANGRDFYDYLATHHEFAVDFHRFMTAQSRLHNAAIVDAYDFGGLTTLVDVGGGRGATLSAILSRYPNVRGILFDLPEVIAEVSVEQLGPDGRCSVESGDMAVSLPAGGDGYILKRVLIDTTDQEAIAILRNCRAAMRDAGRVLIMDPMLPDHDRRHPNWYTDILMMMVTNGRCRTRDHYRSIIDQAGLRLETVLATESPNYILECRRP